MYPWFFYVDADPLSNSTALINCLWSIDAIGCTRLFVNIGSCNDLFSEGTMPLSKKM